MSAFRVALSGDFIRPDGAPAFPDFDVTALENEPGVEVAYVQPVDGVMPAAGLADFDALILLVPRFARESVPAGGRLGMVARFGVGYDNVDLAACTDNSIAAVITPDGVRRPVAVAIITFMLALAGKLMLKDALCRAGPAGWDQKIDHMGVGVVGKTLGSIGIGNIGAEMFRLARPFDMEFIAHDPFADEGVAAELGVRLVGLEELFANADFLAVNCPWVPETTKLVNAERLASMKPTAFVINTARGPIVDQAALAAALRDGTIAGAALDVFEDEPTAVDDPIFLLDNVICTPHALCWTDQCFAGIGAADVKAAVDMMHGQVPVGVVNREVLDTPAWQARLKDYGARFGSR